MRKIVALQLTPGVVKRLIDACAAAKADDGKEIADMLCPSLLGQQIGA